MGLASTLMTIAVLAGPPVEVSLFVGEDQAGEMVSLTDGNLTLSQDGQEKQIAITDVLEVRFGTKAGGADVESPRVRLVDGSEFTAKSLTSSEKTFTVESAGIGQLELPKESISSIRLAADSNALRESWNELAERQENSDLLVIPKGELLDFLRGGVGPITDANVQFFLGGNQVAVKRERIYGIVYGSQKQPQANAICRAVLPNRDSVQFQSIRWADDKFVAKMVAGVEVTLAPDQLMSLDFSLGKVQYLTDIEPREKKITPALQDANAPPDPITMAHHDVQINRNSSWEPLTLNKKVYARGLCLHSKTELTYRLSKQIRRFQAVMGIDDHVAVKGLGDVKVIIRADGKALFDEVVKAGDQPRKLDLDLTGVVNLEIIVDFVDPISDVGVGDQLVLADAKFIK